MRKKTIRLSHPPKVDSAARIIEVTKEDLRRQYRIIEAAQAELRRRYEKHAVRADGWTDWYRPVRKGYRMRCCDCGLVHEVDFRVKDKHIEMRARRDERATGATRRKR